MNAAKSTNRSTDLISIRAQPFGTESVDLSSLSARPCIHYVTVFYYCETRSFQPRGNAERSTLSKLIQSTSVIDRAAASMSRSFTTRCRSGWVVITTQRSSPTSTYNLTEHNKRSKDEGFSTPRREPQKREKGQNNIRASLDG